MPPKTDRTTEKQAGNSPVFKTKVGRVHLAAFEQEGERGTFLSITLKRVYKADSGYKDAFSFALSDLDDASRCFEEVKAWASKREN